MEFISNSNTQRFKTSYERNLEKIIFTNYNYRASNENQLDNYSCTTCNYILHPNVNITYPKPFNTGKCVSPKEREQVPFDIHKNSRLFSDIIDSAKEQNKNSNSELENQFLTRKQN